MLIISRKIWCPLRKQPYLLSSPRMHLRYFSIWGEGLCCLIQISSRLSAHIWETAWKMVCGWGLVGGSLVSFTPVLSESPNEDHPNNISQMRNKLSIFSSSDTCHGISQKWYLNNHMIKSRFNKNNFHIQFYIMRTIQHALARFNYFADVEKMNSDGKLHV